MDIILLVLGILALMTISIIATHLWVGIWDFIGASLKKLFHIGKQEKINWHTLDGENKSLSKDQIKQSEDKISANERQY